MTPRPTYLVRDPNRAFFGRKIGKTLKGRQQALMGTLLPHVTLPESGPIDPAALFGGAPVFLEIGFGGGEHLARQARAQPEAGFIGADGFVNAIAKLLEKIDADKLTNLRVFHGDAMALLARLAPRSLDGVFLLYPDPWPKTRHHKRRFISANSLDALARVLKPEGFLRVATDIEDYAVWTLAHILRHPDFHWPIVAPGSWRAPYPDWQPTRYEQKARREGRSTSAYFEFRRHAAQ